MRQDLFRQLPSVDRLLGSEALKHAPPALARLVARRTLESLRAGIASGELQELPDVQQRCADELEALQAQRLRRVINATGVVLHTNLGRAPMPPQATAAAAQVAQGYSNVELDLGTGKRGGRLSGIKQPLKLLLGCEDAIAVNNNAAAVVLVLMALARGREVVVSRGELVEIGGSFRVPDIMQVSGAVLREVGTTNRTRASDYQAAIGPETALLMRVHPSNFRITGFTERPDTASLAELGVPLVEDLGSGSLFDGVGDEPRVAQVLADGAALVCFSGDKLLGGPQAGIIAGQAELVAACRKHPLYRAMRLDKVALAALEATLRVALAGERDAIPALRMLNMQTREPAELLAARLRSLRIPGDIRVEADLDYTGGGALPGQGLPTHVVAVRGQNPDVLAARLRAGSPPVVARVARDALVLSVRTLLPGDLDTLCACVQRACAL